MTLADDLQVTLKDFLPETADRRLISDPSGPAAVVGSRLHDNLQSYAAARRISVENVVDQLRSEIRQHTMADADEVDFLTEALKRVDVIRARASEKSTLARLTKDAATPIAVLLGFLLDEAPENAARHAAR